MLTGWPRTPQGPLLGRFLDPFWRSRSTFWLKCWVGRAQALVQKTSQTLCWQMFLHKTFAASNLLGTVRNVAAAT